AALVLAAVGEELGLVGLLVIAVAYVIVGWRGLRIARSAPSDYGFFLSTALTLFLIVPALVMAAGVVGVIPLTGVVTPFLSYGGAGPAAHLAPPALPTPILPRRRARPGPQPFPVPPLRCG